MKGNHIKSHLTRHFHPNDITLRQSVLRSQPKARPRNLREVQSSGSLQFGPGAQEPPAAHKVAFSEVGGNLFSANITSFAIFASHLITAPFSLNKHVCLMDTMILKKGNFISLWF